MSNSLGLCTSLRKSNLLPVVTLSLKLRDTLLKVLKSLSRPLTGLAGSEGVTSTLHGHSVGGILNDNGGQRLVSLTRANARDGRVLGSASDRGVARLATSIA